MVRSSWLLTGVGVLCAWACTASPTAPMPDAGAVFVDAAPDAASTDARTGEDAASDAQRPEPRRVLFVGNSYTNFNMLPSVVQELTAARDDVQPLEVESLLVDGATLWDHWTATGARERIETGAFDVVVLQAQSTEPIRDRRGDATGFSFAARFLSEAAVATGARVVYYVTWARRAGHPDYERLRLGDPATMTRDLEIAFSGVAFAGTGAAHVGLAFEIALSELPDVELYAEDGSHPSPAGSFLAACVLSQMVGGEYPRVPSTVPLGLDPNVANDLCAIAPRVACTTGEFCHGVCVRTDFDPLHCSACDAACPGDFPCIAGMCQCEFPEWTPCPGRRCAYLPLDEYNCGACGRACEAGQDCLDGECECPAIPTRIEAPSGRLAELRPGCARGSLTADGDCAAAIAEHCEALGCFDTGISLTPFPAMAPSALCLTGETITRTFAELAALEPGCTGADVSHEPACTAAVHRACVAAGAVSGLASIRPDATSLTMTCLRDAAIARTTFTALTAELSFCDGTTTRWGAACNFASASVCRSLGHTGGYGPVEAIGDDLDIVCLDY